MRRITTWLIVAVAGTVLVAGCGSSGSSTTNTSTETTPATAPSSTAAQTTTTGASTTTTAKPSTTSSGSSAPSASNPPAEVPKSPGGAKAVASCKHAIATQAALPAAVKTKLENICNKAAGGSTAELEKVAHEECVTIVTATPLPAGVSRARALAICSTPAGTTG